MNVEAIYRSAFESGLIIVEFAILLSILTFIARKLGVFKGDN